MREKEITDTPLSPEIIKEKIYIIRDKKVMLDKDLAVLYGVTTKALNQAVKRNAHRFPGDFMFQLNKEESGLFLRSQIVTLEGGKGPNLKSQFVTSSYGGTRKLPVAFTEQGIAMLSSVLRSERAILVNIQIIRTFTKLREMIDAYKELREKVEEMEKNNETNFKVIFDAIRLLIKEDNAPKEKVGFRVDE